MPYASTSNVANYCRNLLGSASDFSSSTSPSSSAVNDWLSSGCSVIESRLAADGWSTPIANTTQLYAWLHDLNTLYAAARAEMSRTNVTLAPGERTRGQVFDEMFWKQLDTVCTMDLATMGGQAITSGLKGQSLFVSGTTVSGKDTQKSTDNRVKPRFSKGMFNMPGTINQNSAERAEESGEE